MVLWKSLDKEGLSISPGSKSLSLTFKKATLKSPPIISVEEGKADNLERRLFKKVICDTFGT